MSFATHHMPTDSASTCIVEMPPTLTARALDGALAEIGSDQLPESMLLDLSRVSFVDPTALLYLTACISTLIKQEVDIALEMPARGRVRDLMRRYRFGTALQGLIDRPAIDLLTERSRRYLSDRATHYRAAQRHVPGLGLVQRASERLAALDVIDRPDIDRAVAVADRWREPEVKALLTRHLGGRSNLIAPGIVFEALANAVFHPHASRVVSTGYLDRRASRGDGAGLLTVAFWDNGHSLVPTLREALISNGRLRNEDFELYYDYYALYEGGVTGPRVRAPRPLYSGDDVRHDASDAELLVAATFPGVTRDPTGPRPSTALARFGPKYNRPGMGLYVLTSLAVDSFGGEVLIRTGTAFANFKRAPRSVQERHDCRYSVKVVTSAAMGRYFSGNEIVVRLPLAA